MRIGEVDIGEAKRIRITRGDGSIVTEFNDDADDEETIYHYSSRSGQLVRDWAISIGRMGVAMSDAEESMRAFGRLAVPPIPEGADLPVDAGEFIQPISVDDAAGPTDVGESIQASRREGLPILYSEESETADRNFADSEGRADIASPVYNTVTALSSYGKDFVRANPRKVWSFEFNGGAQLADNANFKFFCFVVDQDGVERILYRAQQFGLVESGYGSSDWESKMQGNSRRRYVTVSPILKIFTSTSGFGIAKEYFSFFVLLTNSGNIITINPLSHKRISNLDWSFTGEGRFLTRKEIREVVGEDSDTYKYYLRQAMLSRRRLREIVQVRSIDEPDVVEPDVRLLRFE